MDISSSRVASATKEALRKSPDLYGDDLEQEVQEVLSRWADEEAHDRELLGHPLDTPSLQSCDQSGSGEGRYHGVIR